MRYTTGTQKSFSRKIRPIYEGMTTINNVLRTSFYRREIIQNGVGVVPIGLDVPKNPVFMRVSGLGTF